MQSTCKHELLHMWGPRWGLFTFLLLLLTGASASALPRKCGDQRYYDKVMDKCEPCGPLCMAETLETECPKLCPVYYANLIQKDKKTSSVAPPPPTPGTKPPSPRHSDPEVGAGSSQTKDDLQPAESQGGSSGLDLHTPIILAVTCVGVVGVVVVGGAGVFIWQKKRPPARRAARRRSPIWTPRSSGNTSVNASQDLEMAQAFLLATSGQAGGSLPALDDRRDVTIPRRPLLTPMNDRPVSVGDLPQVHLGRVTTQRGNPVAQPEDHTSDTTGCPLTDARKFRSEGDAIYREMRVTSV